MELNVNVNVDQVDLTDLVGYNSDDSPRTLGDKVAEQIVARIAHGPHWEGITVRVEKVRDEMIRAVLTPIVAEAMESPTVRTNFLGQPTGDKRTMRDLILEHTRDFLNTPIDGQRQNGTVLEQYIRSELVSAVQSEVIAAVAAVRDRVLTEIGENMPGMVGAAVQVALKAR